MKFETNQKNELKEQAFEVLKLKNYKFNSKSPRIKTSLFMRKKVIRFPIFSSRQNTRHSKLKSQERQTNQIQSKKQCSLLKIMNEDIKRIKSSKKKDFPQIENMFSNKLNVPKTSLSSKRNQIISKDLARKVLESLTLEINKINQRQNKKTITLKPCLSIRVAKGQKIKPAIIPTKKPIKNVNLSSQKVIVISNRRQFSKINQEIIYQRRQNYLNANFNKRKNHLNDITKANKKIYDRINSQRSYYSTDELNRSYESNASISKNLSNSKLSRRSRLSASSKKSITSSRCSVYSKKGDKIALPNHNNISNKKLIKLQSKSINQINSDQVQKFATLFTQKKTQPIRINTSLNKNLGKYCNEKLKSLQSGQKYHVINENDQNDKNVILKTISTHKKCLLPALKHQKPVSQEKSSRVVGKDLKRRSVFQKKVLSMIDQNVAISSTRNSYNFAYKILEEHPATTRITSNQNTNSKTIRVLN